MSGEVNLESTPRNIEYCSMILLQIDAVLRIGHWYRNHNYSDFFIGVVQSLSSLPKGTQALGTRLGTQTMVSYDQRRLVKFVFLKLVSFEIPF